MNIHKLQLAAIPFNAIMSGVKTVESRLFDEKRQKIQLGDEIIFTNRESPDQQVVVRVVGLLRYQNFHDLLLIIILKNLAARASSGSKNRLVSSILSTIS